MLPKFAFFTANIIRRRKYKALGISAKEIASDLIVDYVPKVYRSEYFLFPIY